jgi:colanic acid/amylovoran biosynthesis glycosyltransferase
MSLAYLVNQHPKCSQSFIRRELLALESLGFSIQRFSVRSGAQLIVDPADRAELAKTRVILDVGLLGLVGGLLRSLSHPISLLRALALAVRLGRRSDRGLTIHLIYLAPVISRPNHPARSVPEGSHPRTANDWNVQRVE